MSLADDLNYTGRRVLITGAANGFGAAMAAAFSEAGATVVMADIERETLLPAAARLGAEAHVFDQSDPASIDALATAAGVVDVLINNAGMLTAKPLLETTAAEMRQLVDVDFLGVALMMRAFGAGMVARGQGVVLNISSQTAFCGGEGRAIYAAAKSAVAQLTRSAAVEWGPAGVRVLALAPGRCLTRMTRGDPAGGPVRRPRPVARTTGPMGYGGGDRENGGDALLARRGLCDGGDRHCRWRLRARIISFHILCTKTIAVASLPPQCCTAATEGAPMHLGRFIPLALAASLFASPHRRPMHPASVIRKSASDRSARWLAPAIFTGGSR